MEKLTFKNMPQALGLILEKLAEIEQVLSIKKQSEDKFSEVMGVREAGMFLKLTKSTIYTKVSRGELPAFKSRKRLLFHKTELLEHMQLNKKMSSYQLKKEADLRIRQLPKTRKYTY
ncbi:helix-turn-helix domain-containing protein [Pedobacter fastidiosus]|uniref:Helix-turn-helix domain-containing protein n=1 Tax=Pedobacter fastidiosus TaxID=2765361 RepID=A0ABR7KYN9_9SPHI|nr:helix-turn-helix domain-containing protein [Pedobacter fastidiosus]MBC6113196.1 helix-turn-helix domain-containing protein [Pedobacter fastidiosus]